MTHTQPDHGGLYLIHSLDHSAPLDRVHDQRESEHESSAGARTRAGHHRRAAARDRRDEISHPGYRGERSAHRGTSARGDAAMNKIAILTLAALPLAACNTNTAVGNDREAQLDPPATAARSEEHTSELQSLMRISYAVFC